MLRGDDYNAVSINDSPDVSGDDSTNYSGDYCPHDSDGSSSVSPHSIHED